MVTAPPRLTGVIERMDRPDVDPAALDGALRDLARINRLFGGTRVVLDHLAPLLSGLPSPIRILDVGTGYADVPRAIVRRARRLGAAVRIDALDYHAGIRRRAAHACVGYPEIRLRGANALALPYPDRTVDVVLASQVLHHMEGDEPVRLLREMHRVARHAVLVSDLRRGGWPHAVTRVALLLLSRNPLIRHDGPLSIRRGFTAPELAALAIAADWKTPRVVRGAFFRLVLVERVN